MLSENGLSAPGSYKCANDEMYTRAKPMISIIMRKNQAKYLDLSETLWIFSLKISNSDITSSSVTSRILFAFFSVSNWSKWFYMMFLCSSSTSITTGGEVIRGSRSPLPLVDSCRWDIFSKSAMPILSPPKRAEGWPNCYCQSSDCRIA